MTDLLKRALEEAERVLPPEEQDKLALWLFSELEAGKEMGECIRGSAVRQTAFPPCR